MAESFVLAKPARQEHDGPEDDDSLAMPQHDSRPRRHTSERTERVAFEAVAPRDKPGPQGLQAEIEELFAELWQVPRFAGPAARLPPERRQLPHERAARAHRRRRGPGHRPGQPQHHRQRADAPGRRRAGARPLRRARLPADGDRVRAVPAADPPRRGRRPGARAGAVRPRDRHDLAAGRRGARPGPAHGDRGGAPVTDVTFEIPEQTEYDLDLPATLPILALKDTVVFPQSMMPLAIGQERSIKLIDDVVVRRPLPRARDREGCVDRDAGLRRHLPRRDGRDRPQDDPHPRRDAPDPRRRPAPHRAHAAGRDRAVPRRRVRRAARHERRHARGRGADAERPGPLRADHRARAVPARPSCSWRRRTSTTRARSPTSSPRPCARSRPRSDRSCSSRPTSSSGFATSRRSSPARPRCSSSARRSSRRSSPRWRRGSGSTSCASS